MAPIPLFKVGALVIRTIAKPVAARLMVDAKNHPAVAKICMVCGEGMHQISSRINILAQGYRIVGVSPLSPEEALNNGVGIVSEVLVFCIAGTILVYEYKISEEASAAKAADAAKEKADEKQRLEDRLAVIDTQLLVIADRLKTTEKALQELSSNSTAGAVPYGWIFGLSGNKSVDTAMLNSIGGKATENLPSTMDESDLIDEDNNNNSSGNSSTGSSSSGSITGKTVPGQTSSTESSSATSTAMVEGDAKKPPRTWADWFLWR